MALSDYVTGLSAGYGILGALLGREKSGDGCRVETLLAASNAILYRRDGGGLHANRCGSQSYGQSENRSCICFCVQRQAADCDSLFGAGKVLARFAQGDRPYGSRGRPKIQNAERPAAKLRSAGISPGAGVFDQKPAQWLQRLEADDVPVVPLYNVAEVLKDPQVRHLDLVEELDHPQAGSCNLSAVLYVTMD